MIVGISSRYKQIVRYDLTGASTKADIFREIVLTIVQKCWDVGLKCNALISDMGGSNTDVWKLFGIKGNTKIEDFLMGFYVATKYFQLLAKDK